MTRDDLIKAIAEKTQLTKDNAGKALEAVLSTITETLKQGDSVSFVGFGSFKVSKRAARQGRNPRTGEPIMIAETMVPSFSAGKTLKEAVNS